MGPDLFRVREFIIFWRASIAAVRAPELLGEGSGTWRFFARVVRFFNVSTMRSVDELFGMGCLGKKCTVLETRYEWVLGVYSL